VALAAALALLVALEAAAMRQSAALRQ